MQIHRRGGEPVFVDATGRRRRLFVVLGVSGGLVLLLVALAVVAGFTGAGPGGLPGWPGSDAGRVQGATAAPSANRPTGPSTRPSTSAAATSPGAAPTVTLPAGAGTTPTAAPTITAATPTSTTHRTVPTQTPTAHPSKKP
jgi:hypothetical protein